MDLDLPFHGGWSFILFLIVIGVLRAIVEADNGKKKTRRRKKSSVSSKRPVAHKNRPDQSILNKNFNGLTGFEFERLLALYFKDQGYEVKEVGGGGSDGGVDLILKDREGGKTAVQAKCYADKNIPVQVVRELVGAKRNFGCLYALLITTSDLTEPARREAESLKVEYWHGALVHQKLIQWGKWKPS
jgi:restriction system protein